jgi:hypothetical protein
VRDASQMAPTPSKHEVTVRILRCNRHLQTALRGLVHNLVHGTGQNTDFLYQRGSSAQGRALDALQAI